MMKQGKFFEAINLYLLDFEVSHNTGGWMQVKII